jgi:putative ABC transport system permease protein
METSTQMDSFVIQNDISRDYIAYLDAMPKEYYAAMVKSYGIDMLYNIYTDFYTAEGTEPMNISVEALTNRYKSILSETDFKEYSSYITTIVPSFVQAPNNAEYIQHQYDVIGKVATEKNEVMLVLDPNDRLSDVLLARLGYYTEEEFINIIHDTNGELPEGAPYKEYFTYEELLGKTFTWYSNDQIFTDSASPMKSIPFDYQYDSSKALGEGLELTVSGILLVKETTTYGCLTSGIYYTEALTNHVLANNMESKIVKHVNDKGGEIQYLASPMQGISYTYTYTYDGVEKTATAYVGSGLGLESMMGSMGGSGSGSTGGSGSGSTGGSGATGGMGGMGGMGGLGSLTMSIKTIKASSLGGNDLATGISIYPVSFDDKDLVTDYLDKWNNKDITIEINGKTLTGEERSSIKYLDALELVIVLINTMIDVVSYALIAFTSVSLVVSTVMIGIITYVSVVERIKEIGVIRSLGGRKKDVSRLFTAETAIIGALAGAIGVGVTYGVSAIVNAILFPLTGIPSLAQLPFTQALLMIALSVGLTLISGVFPARAAAQKDPVVALRTE